MDAITPKTADIQVYRAGSPPEKINSNEIATFDLRLSGYTLTEMLDTSRPLAAPRHATLTVVYRDGRRRTWAFSQEGYAAQYENQPGQAPLLRLTAETVTES